MPSKRYSIVWQDEQAVSFQVDGVPYARLEEIPDPADRARLQAMLLNEQTAPAQKESLSAGPPIETIIFNVFSGIAAILLLVTILLSGLNLRRWQKESAAPGTVVEMTRRVYTQTVNGEEIDSVYYTPVVRFTAQDGRRHDVQMQNGSDRPAYEIGDQVTVRYDPQRPLDARIADFGGLAGDWIFPGITGILALAFGGAVFLAKRALR